MNSYEEKEEELKQHLAKQNLLGCTCPYRWGSPGKLYEISMMDQFLRISTDKDCKIHNLKDD